jgi:hypothetical protein
VTVTVTPAQRRQGRCLTDTDACGKKIAVTGSPFSRAPHRPQSLTKVLKDLLDADVGFWHERESFELCAEQLDERAGAGT